MTEEVTRDEFIRHEAATKDVIDVKRIYIDMAGDLVAGVLLSQIVFWYLPTPEGKSKLRVYHEGEWWLAKGREDWWDECRITAKQFDRAVADLERLHIVVTDLFKFNGSPMKHVRIDWDVFLASYDNILRSYPPEGVKSILPKRQNPISPKGKMDIDETVKSLTESTSESTSEIESAQTALTPNKKERKERNPNDPSERQRQRYANALAEWERSNGDRAAIADPRIAERAYRQEVGAAFAAALGHEQPSANDLGAAGKLFGMGFPATRAKEFLANAQGYSEARTKDGKPLTAYQVIGNMDDWRQRGYDAFPKVETWDTIPRFRADA